METMVVLYASCLRESNSSDHKQHRKYGLPYLTEFGNELERTLKIKQCKTRTKTHKYPLILTQYEKNPETRNCFQIRRQRAS